jgi:uncharacterized membrane protein
MRSARQSGRSVAEAFAGSEHQAGSAVTRRQHPESTSSTLSDRLIVVGRTFAALALVGLGVEHFILGDFMAGRAPAWPEGVPGGHAWAYATGAALVLVGAAVLIRRGGRVALILAAGLVMVWALLRHVPIVATAAVFSVAWTEAGKALMMVGGALAVAATLPAIGTERGGTVSNFVNLRGELIVVGRVCLGIFLVITGIQHYTFTEFVASLIPGWFPGNAVFWTYFTGVALIAGGIGLWIPRTARLAAFLVGLMVFSWFWIIHVPRTFLNVSSAVAVCEALFVSGFAFVLAGYSFLPATSSTRTP